jgi:biotin transport system substrate-specific component
MNHTLADCLYQPSDRSARIARDAVLILGASLLVAVSAKVQFPGVVPLTLQPWAVLLVGAALGRCRGAMALVAYLLEGAAGLPVFAHPAAGPGYFLGPTGGYLLSFPVAAYVVGALAERGWDRRIVTTLAAFALGQAIVLVSGFSWLAVHVGARAALWEGVIRVLPGDVLKIALAAVALPAAWRVVGSRGPSAPSRDF